ncbi:MAG: hypothetical protein U0325_10900 [Polyangiales bacterium]
MPYAFSRDESTLLLLDGHGLTRVDPRGRTRHAARVTGGDDALVTLDDEGRRGVAWLPTPGRAHAVTLPGLGVTSSASGGDFVLAHPTRDEEVGTYAGTFSHVSRSDGARTGAPWASPVTLDLSVGPADPSRDLLTRRWHRTSGGRFALLCEVVGDALVYVGDTTEHPWRGAQAWRFALRGDGFSRVWANPGGATVAVHDLRSARAFFATLDATSPARTFSLPARCPPARRGEHWITQVDDATVLALDASGATHARWTLPPGFAGAGELLVGERRAWWRSPDGSRLFDLDAGAVVARPLPAVTAAFRPAVDGWIERLHTASARHGLRFSLAGISPEARGARASVALCATPGDRSFAAWFLRIALLDPVAWRSVAPLRPASLVVTGLPPNPAGAIDVPAVRDAFELSNRLALPLPLLAASLWIRLEWSRHRWCCWEDEAPTPWLPREGASLLARGLLAHLAVPVGEDPPALTSPGADLLTVDAAIAGLAAVHPSQRAARVMLTTLVLVLESLSPDDVARVVAWCHANLAPQLDPVFWDGWRRLRVRLGLA